MASRSALSHPFSVCVCVSCDNFYTRAYLHPLLTGFGLLVTLLLVTFQPTLRPYGQTLNEFSVQS